MNSNKLLTGTSPVRSHRKDFGKMIRLSVAEKGFALALIVSAAIHAALLPLLLSFATGSASRHVQPVTEICINAFLVPGTLSAVGKSAFPGRKRPESIRAAPVAAAPPREVQENVPPAKKEGMKPLADIRPPAEWFEMGHDAGALPASPVLVQGGGDLSGSNGAGVLASRREGTGKIPQEGSDVWSPKDADAIPRYGDNVLPAYPPLARLRGYQGMVVLFVEVLADGRVGQVGIRRSTGHEILDRAALEAIRTWRFEPGRRTGRAVTMSVEVPVRFVLNGNSVW